MSVLRIYGSLLDPPRRCQWALVSDGREPVTGEGRLAELPRGAKRVQLVLPAAQVLLTRARVPRQARSGGGSLLAFAIEEHTSGEPDANQVSWIGAAGDADVFAVADRGGLARWREALESAGIRAYEVCCETLLLPWSAGEWSLAWNGGEGFVRTGKFEGAMTDCGDRESPPLALRLLVEEAQARGSAPESIALFTAAADAAPDLDAWRRALGCALRLAGYWDWRSAPPDAGVCLMRERERWLAGCLPRLRSAAWIAGGALAIHALALAADWALLAREQRALRQHMEARFRAVFPDAVAVVDPALQMRRKLADARHAAGLPDDGDFLAMIEKVAMGLKALPAGSLRAVSYESGRLALEISTTEEVIVRRVVAGLLETGLSVDRSAVSARSGSETVIITVGPS